MQIDPDAYRTDNSPDFIGEIERLPEAIHDSRSPRKGVIVNDERPAHPPIHPMWGFDPPPPLRWFVEGVIPEGFPTILAADGGIGKSYLALHLAACVLRGIPFLGLSTTQSSVLFVDYELDVDEQRRRWMRVLAGMGIDQNNPALKERFNYVRPKHPLSSNLGHDAVIAAKKKTGAGLIILDSLTIAMQADATSQRDVVSVMGRFREWGTVFAIDHISGAGAAGNQSKARPFGSVFKRNIARSVLNLIRVDGGGRLLRATKTNFAEAADLISFSQEFEQAGEVVVFRPIDLASDEMIGSIDHLNATEITLKAVYDLGSATAEAVVAWRRDHDAPEVKEGTIRNHFTSLKRQGKITLIDGVAQPAGSPRIGTEVSTPAGNGKVVDAPAPETGRVPVKLDGGEDVRYFDRESLSSRSRSRHPLETVNRDSAEEAPF